MIKCSTLEEIKSLMVIKNCCANTQECSYCRFADICEWMSKVYGKDWRGWLK